MSNLYDVKSGKRLWLLFFRALSMTESNVMEGRKINNLWSMDLGKQRSEDLFIPPN